MPGRAERTGYTLQGARGNAMSHAERIRRPGRGPLAPTPPREHLGDVDAPRDMALRLAQARILARWVRRDARGELLAWLAPRWLAVALAWTQLDAMVSWPAVGREWRAQPAWAAFAAAILMIGISALESRRVVARLLLGPRLGALRRQPVEPVVWGPAALVVLAPVAGPLAVLGAIGYGPGGAALWAGLGVLPALAVAARRPGWAAAALVGASAVAALAHAGGALAWAAAAWAISVPLAGIGVARWAADGPAVGPAPVPWRPTTPLRALVHRDLLLLWRTERPLLASSLGAVPVVAAVTGMLAWSGDWDGATLTLAATCALAPCGWIALAGPAAVARGLGRRFDPPEWPVTGLARAGSLAVVAGLLLAPGWAAAAVAAPAIGSGHVQIARYPAAISAGGAWWVAARPARPGVGTWPWWLGLCAAASLVRGGALWTALIAAVALQRAASLLERRRGRP